MKYLANGVVFVLVYIVFMVPTYILPYLGSNSSVVAGAGAAADAGVNPATWPHLASFLVLIAITWLRGTYIDKKWLVVFPVLAIAFDFIPGLSFIPLVPTVMHLLAIILGVAGAKAIATATAQDT